MEKFKILTKGAFPQLEQRMNHIAFLIKDTTGLEDSLNEAITEQIIQITYTISHLPERKEEPIIAKKAEKIGKVEAKNENPKIVKEVKEADKAKDFDFEDEEVEIEEEGS